MKYSLLACVFSFLTGITFCNLLAGLRASEGLFAFMFDCWAIFITAFPAVYFWFRSLGRRDETRMEVEQE